MKIADKLKPSRFLPKGKKGVALVTVLTVMSLTTILVLTFFSLATSEHRSSSTYSNGLQAQQVAEQAVNMVIAQIREATTVGRNTAWASQPGSIRNWDDSGGESLAYKLYSDDTMKTLDWDEFETDFLEMGQWNILTSHFVDLNEPVIRGEKVYYPIVHPLASTEPKWPQALGDDRDGIEGFSYNMRSDASLDDSGEFGRKAARIIGAEDHVAMPVRWIYQLADGTLGTLSDSPSGGTTEAYTFNPLSGSNTPTAENQIVARFAFWSDDETSKLNINTHAGGLAWDVPKAGGALDMSMAKFQPAQKEWQRYPGHPATTHLSPALAPGVLDIVNDRDAMEMLYEVVPRVVGGGSESGTRVIDTRRKEEANGLIADKEPLFPSLDDVIMKSDRTPHSYPDAQGNPIADDELSEYLERAKFFMTVNSRAPETNMFNLPRVAMWPIYNAEPGDTEYETHLTAFDRLIHYCSSMGESPGGYPRYEYIFKREDADSPSYDYEVISRNKDLYSYLLDALEAKVPGYGDSFQSKYPGGDHRQILTQIFDYIRTTNLHDDSIYGEDYEKAFVEINTNRHPTYTNPRNERNKAVGQKGHGQVVPINIADTKGFGRFYSLGGVQVQVISVAEPGDRGVPSHMGARSYRGRNDQQPSSTNTYLNFPPIPLLSDGTQFPKKRESESHAEYESRIGVREPTWLAGLRRSNTGLYNAAFEPRNWNWQLAYLDRSYCARVLADPSSTRTPVNDPSAFKFKRSTLTPVDPAGMNPFSDGTTRLSNDEQMVQAMLLFNLFTPSIGWGSINPDMEIRLSIKDSDDLRFIPDYNGRGFQPYSGATGVPFIGFTMIPEREWIFSTNATDTAWGGRRYGGLMPYEFLLNAPWDVNRRVLGIAGLPRVGNPSTVGGRGRFTWLDRGYEHLEQAVRERFTDAGTNGDPEEVANSYRYDLVTIPFKIGGARYDQTRQVFNPGRVQFVGGELTFEFFHGGIRSEGSAAQGSSVKGVQGDELLQTVTVDVPDFDIQYSENADSRERAPVIFNRDLLEQTRSDNGGYFNEFDILSKDTFGFLERNNLGMDPGNPVADGNTRISFGEGNGNGAVANGRFAHISVHRRPSPFAITDLVQSIELRHGDARISAGKQVIEANEVFAPHRLYNTKPMAHSVTNAVGADYRGATIEAAYLIRPDLPAIGNRDPYNNRAPLPFGVEESQAVQLYGDFDNGAGLMIDGPYINKPDEGNIHSLKGKWARELQGHWEERRNYGEFPYFNREWRHEAGGPAYFSPNRLVSGPGMFGSLPTGVMADTPWQTLLFRPNTTGSPGYASHPGAKSPPDHLIMDLFWMPIVEPYAISEPLSTAGKVNLNCQLVPFLHVERDTALRGVFRSEFMVCIPNKWHTDYKHNHGRGRGYHWRDNPYGGELQGRRLRSAIVERDTLEQFYTRFRNGRDIFKSSTEICEIHLIPEEITKRLGLGNRGSIGSYTPSLSQMESGSYWEDHSLVGENSRERPYTNIQNRVTTKSNTFKVHYRAQVVKQARRDSDADYAQWRPEYDTVQAEYRGSSIVERYVDPNSDILPDFATESGATLDDFYQYRVVNPRRFAP